MLDNFGLIKKHDAILKEHINKFNAVEEYQQTHREMINAQGEAIKDLVAHRNLCDMRYRRHEEKIEMIIALQQVAAKTQESICTSLNEMTGDIKGMRGDVEIVASGRVAVGVIRKSILWVASVIGGLGVIVGAIVTTYAYLVHGVDLISNLLK